MSNLPDIDIDATNPDVAEAADKLRRQIARWRDDLRGRQRGNYSHARQDLIDELGDLYRDIHELKLQTEKPEEFAVVAAKCIGGGIETTFDDPLGAYRFERAVTTSLGFAVSYDRGKSWHPCEILYDPDNSEETGPQGYRCGDYIVTPDKGRTLKPASETEKPGDLALD